MRYDGDMPSATTTPDIAQEAVMNTHPYICPCGDCGGDVVEVAFVGGFIGTTCEVAACSYWQARGMRSFTVRRSAVGGWVPAGERAAVRHADGLVGLAG